MPSPEGWRQIYPGGHPPRQGIDLRELGFVGTVSDAARREIREHDIRVAKADLSRPLFR